MSIKTKFLTVDDVQFEFFGVTYFGQCTTNASTQAKTVSINGIISFDLRNGTRIVVKFTNGQSYNGVPTLNVNSTGAKNIKLRDGDSAGKYEWDAGAIIGFVYYNGYWIIENGDHASVASYGRTMLTNSLTNSQTTALTPYAVQHAGFAMASDIPSDVSELNNDAGYITLADLPIYGGGVG